MTENEALGLWHAGRYDTLAAWTAVRLAEPEIAGQAYLKLYAAAQRFDPTRGVLWTTYAHRAVAWARTTWLTEHTELTLGDHAESVSEDRPRLGPPRCPCGEALDGRTKVFCRSCAYAIETHGRCRVCGVPRFKQKSRRLCAHPEGRP